ncbi:MAG: alpha/beta hydrolase [Ktedonobacteraceae bacterium]
MDDLQPSAKQANSQSAPTGRPRRGRKLGQRAAQVFLVLLLCAGCFLSLFPLGRALTRSALLIPALLSASAPAPLVLTGDSVSFKRLTISSAVGPVFLDIYEPTGPPPPIPGGREAIIDAVGVGDNRAVPQLVNLSQSLAREGIVVVNVGTPTLFRFQVSARDGEAVVQAFEFMEHWPGVNPHHIGIIAFSVSDELACVAAADPRIRNQVAFLGFLAGYFDVTSLLRTVGMRAQDVNGQMQPWHPITTTLYVLAYSMSSQLSPSDQKLLLKAFPLTKFAPPLTRQQQAQLSPDAAAFYHLLEGDEPGSVNRNLAALSPGMKSLLAQLSPMSYINQIRAPIHLLHDRNDPDIPFSQTQEFAAALARIHHPYDFAAFTIFSHVVVQPGLGLTQELGDGTKLFEVFNSMLLVGS